MEFSALIERRRSVRVFTDKKLTREQVECLLRAGVRAPNACNAQSWRFFVVSDPAVKAKFAAEKICAPWVCTAPVIFVLGADSSALRPRFGDRAEKFVLQDTALAAENMLLAAAEMDLGGCFVGSFDEEKCRRLLDIPESIGIHMLLPIGEAAEEIPDRGRNSLEEYVSWIGADFASSSEYRRTPFVMSGASCREAKFINVDFTGARFTECKFNNADFTDCDITGMKVDFVDMTKSVRFPRRWDAGFYGSSVFFDANLRESVFEDVTLDEARFENVCMKNASFRNTEITDSDLSGITVDGISLEEAIAFFKENKK